MRIAVVTLPLHTNYGGLLQAYALKTALEGEGHEVTVLDLEEKMPAPKGVKAPFIYLKRMLNKLVKGSRAPEVFREIRYRKRFPVMTAYTSVFVEKYISPRMIRSYRDVKEGEYDAFVVGSDQVWRPRYFNRIEDAFLAFAEGWDVRRIAYAASFGTDRLEYDYTQLDRCAGLLSGFDGVSVREDSAVRMCEEWLDHEGAVHVLDPVMLLDRGYYENLSSEEGVSGSKDRIMTYILDKSQQKSNVVSFMSRVSGLEVYGYPLDGETVPPIQEWIAAFRDAGFVITDSFHGCVLSILFHKKFIAVGNSIRGMARLNSLLSMFALDDRLVHGIDPDDDGEFFLSEPDWEAVDKLLEEQIKVSSAFLASALSK